MTVTTGADLPFAGGTFQFHLTEAQMWRLELGIWGRHGMGRQKINIGAAYARLIKGRFLVDGADVGSPGHAEYSVVEMNAIIECALIGGGGGTVNGQRVTITTENVDDYMRRYVHPLPLMERWDLALAVLGARIEGAAQPGDQNG